MQEMQDTGVRSLSQEDTLEEETATHSSILAWEIPWSEEPGRSQRVGHDLVTKKTNQNCPSRSWDVKPNNIAGGPTV